MSDVEQCFFGPLVGCLLDIGDDKLPNYNMGIIIGQYKDPYKPRSIMECHKGLVHAAHDVFPLKRPKGARQDRVEKVTKQEDGFFRKHTHFWAIYLT